MTIRIRCFSLTLLTILMCLLLTLAGSRLVTAQSYLAIRIDNLHAGIIIYDFLPVDVNFVITGSVPGIPSNLSELEVKYRDLKDKDGAWKEPEVVDFNKETHTFKLHMPPLKPNRYFRFLFTVTREMTEDELTTFHGKVFEQVDKNQIAKPDMQVTNSIAVDGFSMIKPNVSTSANTVDADGATIIQVLVDFDGAGFFGLPSEERFVTFETTGGAFSPEGVEMIKVRAENEPVTAYLRSPSKVGTAFLRATVNNVSDATSVKFVRALPSRMMVTTDRPAIEANFRDRTMVIASLLRDIGTVTPGTVVHFSATDTHGNPFGFFTNMTLSDKDGAATAEFTAGPNVPHGPATITAVVEVEGEKISDTATIQILPSLEDLDDILTTLHASPTSIPADGFSRTTLEAHVNPDAIPRTITFTTSEGLLFGPNADIGREITITADVNGRAIAQLQSSTTVGTALVQAEVTIEEKSIARQIGVDFVPVESSDIIKTVSTSAASDPVDADGATVTQVFADIASDLPSDKRTVTFTTTLGEFVSTGSEIATSDLATVSLRSPNEAGTAFITATVNGFSAETRVKFVRALPESVIVDPAGPSVSAGGNIDVTVTLLRNIGTVTPGTVVRFSATDDSDNTFGLFRLSVAEIEDGGKSVETTFFPGNILFRGIATIKADVGGVKGEAEIEIVD